MEYLKRLLKPNENILKVKREKTQHVPKEETRRFKTTELFLLLEQTLQVKKLPPTGFTELNMPDIA